MFLSVNDVLKRGLIYAGYNANQIQRVMHATNVRRFQAHYGSLPLVIADIWHQLCHSNAPRAQIPLSERTERGFKKYLVMHYFLWTYPKNREIMASRFGLSEREVSGEALWKWICRVQALKADKIVWEEALNQCNAKMIISVDGVDFKISEPSTSHFNRDPAWCSNKFKGAGVRYEIGIAIYTSKLVWINGPFKCGNNPDTKIFKQYGLRDKIPDGKKGVADRGYKGHEDKLCLPSDNAPQPVKNFLSRVRCRHETFNRRLKSFESMNQVWRHGFCKHKQAFEAVSIICQIQMDNGAFLFAP